MKSSPDGLHNTCKECRKARERQRHHEKMADPVKAEAERARGREKMRRKRESDPEAVNAYQRQWRAANPGKSAVYTRKSYYKNDGATQVRARRAANPELYRDWARRWRAANPEKVASYSAKWREANRHAVNDAARQYREAKPDKHRVAVRNWQLAHPEKMAQYGAARRALKLNASAGEPVDYPAIYAVHDDCYLCARPLTNPMHMDHVVPLSKGGAHTTANLLPTHARCNLRKNDALLTELPWYDGPTDLGSSL